MDSRSLIGDIAQNVQEIRLTRYAQGPSLFFIFKDIADSLISTGPFSPVAACTLALYGHGIDALARCRPQ